jgi:hypothetical protein
MSKLIGITVFCFLIVACAQHVNPSWEEGNLTKKEHMRRRLERLENTQQNSRQAIKKMFSPQW